MFLRGRRLKIKYALAGAKFFCHNIMFDYVCSSYQKNMFVL